MALILFVIFLVLLFINSLQKKLSIHGTDHFTHLKFINLIRENNHKFFLNQDNLLYNSNVSYPLLYHWVLSFAKKDEIDKISTYFNLAINFISYFAFILFAFFVFDKIEAPNDISLLIIYAAILYIFNPFSHYFQNAKNTGLTARGIGLFLGELLTYLYFLFDFSGNYYVLIGIVSVGYLILLSSQFATQYFIFSSIVLTIISFNPFFLLSAVLSHLLFFIILPKYSINYFRGQIGHKLFYYKDLAKMFILKYRFSIYRDFFYDFWTKLTKLNKNNLFSYLIYVISNPIVILIWGFPLLAFLFFKSSSDIELFFDSSIIFSLSKILLVSLILFFLFSFRKTRFLGEPERYVEFSRPIQAVLFLILFYDNPQLIHWVISISLFFTSIQLIIGFIFNRKSNSSKLFNLVMEIARKFEHYNQNSNIKLLSNNLEIARYFMDKPIKIFYGNVLNNKVGNRCFQEVFKSYPMMRLEIIPEILSEYSINYFLMDYKGIEGGEEFEVFNKSKEQLGLQSIFKKGDLELFKVR